MLMLALFFVAACSSMLVEAEVVQDFQNCLEFFLDKTPPDASLTPSNPARICQLYKNMYRYATMYDTEKRIPIYSAYKCKPGKGQRYNGWMIEPQLVDLVLGKSMEDERETNIAASCVERNQATFKDYAQALFIEKGHLNPVCHQPDEDSRAATSTLTNIVPQFSKLNEDAWANYEESVKREAPLCKDLYVITGAVPGNEYIADGRVNRPSHIWSAACCVSENNHRNAWGAIAKNNENSVRQYSLEELKEELSLLYGKENIDPFNNGCK